MTVTMSDKDTGSVAIIWVEDKEVRMLYAMGNNRERTRGGSLVLFSLYKYYYALTDPIYSSNLGERTRHSLRRNM